MKYNLCWLKIYTRASSGALLQIPTANCGMIYRFCAGFEWVNRESLWEPTEDDEMPGKRTITLSACISPITIWVWILGKSLEFAIHSGTTQNCSLFPSTDAVALTLFAVGPPPWRSAESADQCNRKGNGASRTKINLRPMQLESELGGHLVTNRNA